MISKRIHNIILISSFTAVCTVAIHSTYSEDDNDVFKTTVEADWARQEIRMDRCAGDHGSIRDALNRCERLIGDLSTTNEELSLKQESEDLKRLQERANDFNRLDENERLALYHDIRWLTRGIALENPLLDVEKIVFMKRRRFVCQMLHEYLGYYYDYRDIAGGGVYVLDDPGRSFATRDLIQDRLPKGNYTTLALSYDAGKIYFAFAERAPEKPDYYSSERRCFHLYSMNADGSDLRQLTDGLYDDFDPCDLPDGGIAFMSTRRGGFGRCHNPWEPLPAYTLHRMNPDGSDIRTLSFHETNEWHPNVLPDGRIVYTRWDYVDRSAAHFHGLWVSNPDGSNPRALFGTFTQTINACYQPHPIPGSKKIAFIAGAHHADVGGSLVVVDPERLGLEKESGQDDFSSIEKLTPEVCFPEAAGWPGSYFHSPWPLSENYFLVSFSFDPLPGMGPKVDKDTETGLYYFDRFGNLELLYREEGISCMYPIPLKSRIRPPVLPSTLDATLGDEGEYMLTDIGRSHFALPRSRPIRELRVFQILPKSETHVANKPRLGYANAESARMFLGTVPVESDGSAYFRVPARKPLAFQAIDDRGKAVQGMRSVTYAQPGEQQGCVGCHEPPDSTAGERVPFAMRREPSRIQPGPDGSMPWSYPRLIQPILDAHCVCCHGSDDKCKLTGEPEGPFTVSYNTLKPYVRWYEWGDNTITPIVTHPGRMPADESPLVDIVNTKIQAGKISLSDEELRRLYLWLDGNASFYGTYSDREQLAQRHGESLPPPELQ